MRKRLLYFALSFFILFSQIELFRIYSLAEEITLTEEQKKQLEEATKAQLERMKKDIEKIQNLSNMQEQKQPQNIEPPQTDTQKTQTVQGDVTEPEWDGMYIYTTDKTYQELVKISRGRAQLMKGGLSGRKYTSLTIDPTEINHIPWERFKGFMIKGPNLIKNVQIYRLTWAPMFGLGKAFAFLEGFKGADKYEVDTLNLFPKMRCRTKPDSIYCEFRDIDFIRNYLLDNKTKEHCMFIPLVESNVKGEFYAVCLKE
jgi:hypothetical protein